ncbi:type IV toxin-antitoxin system AbiEi family antitoxin domain-containing protein [Kibdelosporangium aridum]|uniref:type IV toxin-antitoxin system AbiEi family antitoxin domain-containing protein n=1 Tax=Kibdelosporangium aridum TaxID=2030 RepID=UPI0007C545D3
MEAARALELLGEYTAGQWGMVTTRQALLLEVDDVTLHRLKAAGLLETVRHGVHAVTSAAVPDARPEQAVWLSLRPEVAAWERPRIDPDGGVVSHESAARLHGLGDLPNDRVEITVPRRRTTRDPNVFLRRGDLNESEVMLLDGLPVTTPIRTIQDLLDRHADASHVATMIRQAFEAGQIRLDELPRQISPYARRYGAAPGDGADLLEQLMAQIGLSVDDLAVRALRDTLGWPTRSSWADLRNKNITWGELARISPEIMRRVLDDANQQAAPDPNDKE